MSSTVYSLKQGKAQVVIVAIVVYSCCWRWPLRQSARVLLSSVVDPDSGSGAFLTPGSGIRNRFFPDLGSRIPNQYFWELSENILVKNFNNSLKIGPNFFLQHLKNKIIFNFVKFWLQKKVLYQIFFTPLFCCCFWIRDPRSRIRDG